jgi:EmrB/QacA subfamily drug resistance transporter
LIAFRALQGLGAAIVSPATLSIISVTFEEGRERNVALGVWGATGGFGAAAGVLLGGILTDALSWEWIFFVNVPVGIAAVLLAPILLDESRDARVHTFDALGAILVTSGLVSLVYAITQTTSNGWLAGETIAFFVAAVVLLVGFVLWELRQSEPLMRFGILRTRTVLGANVAGFILGAAMFAMFLILTLYTQQILDYSPLRTGFAYLTVAGASIFWAGVASQLVTRIGVKPVLTTGMTCLTLGLLWYTQISVDGSYLVDLLPGFILLGPGIAFGFVPMAIAALAGVRPEEAGLASGLINTSQQIGGALGVAALSTVATDWTRDAIADGVPPVQATVDGFQAALLGAALIAAAGIVVSLTMIRREELAETAEPEPAPAAAA